MVVPPLDSCATGQPVASCATALLLEREPCRRNLPLSELSKEFLRKKLRAKRREHVESLPDTTRALLFKRPPGPLLDLIPENATIGLYRANPFEAPAAAYARFFQERGHALTLPRFETRGSDMAFAAFTDPFDESDLEVGPFGLMQPGSDADLVVPDVLFMPLVAFTDAGARLGQGGGHYDRWLAGQPGKTAIGMAWDAQLVPSLPIEPHDIPLNAVVTPTRLYGPF